MQTLDDRLVTMDDSLLLNYFLHAYDYVMVEKGWQRWHRRADAPAPEAVAPRRLRTVELSLGEKLELGEQVGQPT